MANYNDSELENAFGTAGLAYGTLNPAVVSKQTPYDTNAVDEFSLMRGVIDDYVNPQVLKTESEFVGIVVKVERSILSCTDKGQQLKTIETDAPTFEDCKDPGKDPSRTSVRDGVLMNPEEVKAWQPKHKEFIECKERNKAYTTNILNTTEIQNNIGYVRVCIPELDPRPLPTDWPSSNAKELRSGCLKGQKLALSIAETYPVFRYGLSLTDQNFITPGALVRVRLTYKPMGPQGITSGVPDVSQGGTILEVIRNDNNQPIVLSGGGAASAKDVTTPCPDPPLPPQVVADPTQQDPKLTDENIAGLPFVGKSEIFIGEDKKTRKQLTKNLFLKDFKCRGKKTCKNPPPSTGGPAAQVPSKYYKNVKILAQNLEVLIQYLYPNGVDRKRFSITNGYRTRQYNKCIEGAKNSQHVLARAADITFKDFTPRQVFLAIMDLINRGLMREGGVGYYWYAATKTGFVHYDVRNPGGAGGARAKKTEQYWLGASKGPRWYQLDKKGKQKRGYEANIKKEVDIIGEYHKKANDLEVVLPNMFEDRYWSTSNPPGNPDGTDDARQPPKATE